MRTLLRQRNRSWFRLITIIVITVFLCQNIAWTAPTLRDETLAPDSEFAKLASRIDMEMAGIGHTFIQWIKAAESHTLTQFESLLRTNPQVSEKLNENDINTIFYPNKIELISPHFTLVFFDASQFPDQGIYQIPETNIRMHLYKHTHFLPTASSSEVQSQKPEISIKSQERAILTDRTIPGMNTIPIPKNKKILVIELSSGDHLPFAGNFVKKLQEQNEIRVYTLDNLTNLKEQLSSFRPDMILLPENQPDLDAILENSPFEYTLLYYESLEVGFNENAYLEITKEDFRVGIKAANAYESQTSADRTPFHEHVELSAEYAGAKREKPYAHTFLVTTIENGVLKKPDLKQKYTDLDFSPDLPLVSISPHPDDAPFAEYGLIRTKLRNTPDNIDKEAVQMEERDRSLACKFPGEEDLTTYEKRNIEEFIAKQKKEVLDSEQLSTHNVFGEVTKIIAEHAPSPHEPIEKALVRGEVVTISSADLNYTKYNGREVQVRVCIVKSDIPQRRFFPRLGDKLGIPIYPTLEEKDGKLLLNLNVLSTLLTSPTITPEILTGFIVHELSELLLGKFHVEAVLEERYYDLSEIPARLQWMIDELGRLSPGGNRYVVRLLRQLSSPYKLAGRSLSSVHFEIRKQIEELSELVTRRAQMWLDFIGLIRRSKRQPENKINKNTRNNLIQLIRNYAGGTLGQDDIQEGKSICGVLKISKDGRFEFTLDGVLYICRGFGQGKEMIIIGLIEHEEFGLCLWRFSPRKGTFKVFCLKEVLDNLNVCGTLKQGYRLKSIGEGKYLEEAFSIKEETESSTDTDDEATPDDITTEKQENAETEAAFSKMGEVIKKYGEFLMGGVTLPLTKDIDTQDLQDDADAIEPFSFKISSRKRRRIASIAHNRLEIVIPKKIGDEAIIGLSWNNRWGLVVWLSNLQKDYFVVYRADECLRCWDETKRDKSIYTKKITSADSLNEAFKKANKWMTDWLKEEKAREAARTIIRDYAETAKSKGDLTDLKTRVNEFNKQGAKFVAQSKGRIYISPHRNNIICFHRVGNPGEMLRMRFVLDKRNRLLVVFRLHSDGRRRAVVYSLDKYLDYNETGKERNLFDLYPIAEGEDYLEVKKNALITEGELSEKLYMLLNIRNLDGFISDLKREPALEQIYAIKALLPKLEEILTEAVNLGTKNKFYQMLQALISDLKDITSPEEIWKRQFNISEPGVLELKPGAIIKYDIPPGRKITFQELGCTITGPATIEFTLQNPLKLKDLDDKNLKVDLVFREGKKTAKKTFLLRIARNNLYLLAPDGRRFTLAQLEDTETVREIITDAFEREFAGVQGSIAECLRDLYRNRDELKGKAITVSNTIQPPDGAERWRRINVTRGSPFSSTTIRWELNALAELGFLTKDTSKYYPTSLLLNATPETIDLICSLPELVYPSKFPKDDEIENLKRKISYILFAQLQNLPEIFRKSISSLVTFADKEITRSPFPEESARQDVADALKACITDSAQDKLTRSMAWHVLERIAEDKESKGKVVYSLNTLLESGLNDGNRAQLKNLLEHTKGRVFFYVGTGCLGDPDYEFPKGSLRTIDEIKNLDESGEMVVFMLNKEHRQQLGIDKLKPGKLDGNKLLVPIDGTRDVENDILLGLEIVRNNGNTGELSFVFKFLLIETIKEWLMANREEPTPERIQEILRIEIPEPCRNYLKEIEDSCKYIEDLISSA